MAGPADISPRVRRAVGRLRVLRERSGISRTELARRIEVHVDLLRRIERFETDPRMSVLLALADELDSSLAEILRRRLGVTAGGAQADACR